MPSRHTHDIIIGYFKLDSMSKIIDEIILLTVTGSKDSSRTERREDA